jgi:mitogen-activated protein kinase 1/3
MQEGSVPSYEDRVPLFPGGSCFPLSGDKGTTAQDNERLDQLSVIFGVIGTPSEEDIRSIGSASEYIKSLKKSPSKSLHKIYPAADPAAIDLLKQMLQFNPLKRCTSEEAIAHDFFKDIRQEETELISQKPLISPAFIEANNVNVDEIKKEALKEILLFKSLSLQSDKTEG